MPYLQFLIALLISGHEINKAGNNQGPTIDSLVSLTSGIKYPNSALGNLTVAYEKDETGRFRRRKKKLQMQIIECCVSGGECVLRVHEGIFCCVLSGRRAVGP